MKLWTVQITEVYDKLVETGVHHTRESEIFEFEYWKPSYDWLAQKMTERIGSPPAGVHYPVWFWYKRNGKRKRPDLRSHSSFGPKGQKMVLLEVNMPDDKVVLSDFDAWHSVLSQYHTFHDAKSQAEFDAMYSWLESLSPRRKASGDCSFLGFYIRYYSL